MATQTTNLGLIKPAGTDYVLVSDFNTNADTLDTAIGDLDALQTTEKGSLVGAINDAMDSASATVNVGTTTTGNAGTNASVTNVGTDKDAVFNFTIPRGDPGVSVTVGTTTTGAAGSSASVSNSGTASDPILDFTVPQGANGVGVPTGGAIGQALVKSSGTDYATEWASIIPGGAISSNLLINGGFIVNQLALTGTVTLAAGAYGHDMWKAGAGGCTYTFATSQNITTLTISAGSLIQIIEGINLQSGTVCLSWVGTAQGKISAGSYASSGVTGTATGGTNLNIEFNTGTLSKVQLNYGSVSLPFVVRGFPCELNLCKRYFEKSYDYSVAPGTVNAGGGIWFTNVLNISTANGARWPVGKHPVFTVIKRSNPTVTLYTYGGTAGKWEIPGGADRETAVVASRNEFIIINNTGGTVTPSQGEAYGHWVADARL